VRERTLQQPAIADPERSAEALDQSLVKEERFLESRIKRPRRGELAGQALEEFGVLVHHRLRRRAEGGPIPLTLQEILDRGGEDPGKRLAVLTRVLAEFFQNASVELGRKLHVLTHEGEVS
jgi:hypothetical protein